MEHKLLNFSHSMLTIHILFMKTECHMILKTHYVTVFGDTRADPDPYTYVTFGDTLAAPPPP